MKQLKEQVKVKNRQYDEMRRSMLEEVIYLRDRVYSKKHVEVFKQEDVFRLESFKTEEVIDPQSAKLMNDRLERMRDFYLAK